ncbi:MULTISPECIES: nitroreductase family protein [unclassified Synechocystis]|uniref:nitroreductase family protein n=1 Tax=unclassified Synechocystis TaxID=2640012 RepID=UPI0003FADBB0|nr:MULTISPECIES: nitroreductase family protein [unclassified Synechocystis]AIE75771.1 Oxygen-insensitive NAD(P)H nitroreductase / Dihydropteridine reductase [Synechocystis sp. PCC 6714]MCT0255293.1 nitroreductase family protein [Synechocystis sp. CS-94]
MDTFDAIYQRRSVKHFDPDHRLTAEEERKLLEATIQAPTSFNIQHWRFLIIRDPQLRQTIRDKYGNQAQMTDASLLILVAADVNAWDKDPARYWRNAPQEVANYLVGAIGSFYGGKPELQRDEAQRSIGMAMQNLMLAAKAMGYDSCPMIGFDLENVAKLVKLPADYAIGPMVAIGKRTEDARAKGGQTPLEELVWENYFA